MIVSTIALYVKCPQAGNDPTNFTAPLVPFIPMICILANFYLISQISHLGLALGCGWIGLGVLSYFLYGFKKAAGRTGWSELMRYHLPSGTSDNSHFAPMLTMQEIRPSMSSLIKDAKK
uniref:Cationic amino acid transporter C-terminal domain-containing protein n=1 Tax=Globisporangium ultimum (strain ATCC 200006 / CBS 805.95 / DAOM BR144) TaxID=431595 RepID=K3WEC8_GLOUD